MRSEEELNRARQRLALVHDLHEANPMLGTRGSRLAILYPPIYEMQVRAIIQAAAAVGRRTGRSRTSRSCSR